MTSTVQLEVRVAQRHFITAVPSIKLFAWGEGESGGHVLGTREEPGTLTH